MLRVGVIFGGKSIEREVSFNSGRTICDHLDTQFFKTVPIFQSASGDLYLLPWRFLYRGKIADFQQRLEGEAQKIVWDDLPKLIDFMYLAMHGKWAEDGRVQAMLELLEIPYLGAKVFGASLGMNKTLHNDFLQGVIDLPKGFTLSVAEIASYDAVAVQQKLQAHALTFPLIIKPEGEGSSFGVFVVHDQQHLEKAVLAACYISGSVGQGVLVEEKMTGMEFTCIIITDFKTGKLMPLPPTQVLLHENAQIFDYTQKYMPGAAHEKTPPDCSAQAIEKIQDTCVRAMTYLQFSNMARFDGFLTPDGRVVIIDSNPLSGMGPATFLFRQAAEIGMGHAELINCLIKAELKQYHIEKEVSMVSNTKKIKVAVLFGGASHEKEISLESGRNVCYKLSAEKYEVIPIFVDATMKLHRLNKRLLVCTSTREITSNLDATMQLQWADLKKIADFIFIALHGGKGENGVVQGTLEMLGLPYNGSSIFASALCMDKYKTAQFLKRKGFDVPAGMLVPKQDWVDTPEMIFKKVHDEILYPCIVKPHDDGCSVMVSCVANQQELIKALDVLFEQKEQALIEEKIVGMELTVGVIGNDKPRALAPSQVVSKAAIVTLEEKFLPGMGENQTPARLSLQEIQFVQQTIVACYVALHCSGYARIDCFYQTASQSPTGEQRLIILENNSLPGLTPATCFFHQAAEEGLRPMDVLDEIIQLGFDKHKQDTMVVVDEVLARQEQITKQL